MNIKNILKKAARFILSAGQQPVHIEIGTIAPSEMLSGRKIVILVASEELVSLLRRLASSKVQMC